MSADRAEQGGSFLSDDDIRKRMLADPELRAGIEEIQSKIKSGDSFDRALTEEELRSLLRDEP
jgi:hypothetical protein